MRLFIVIWGDSLGVADQSEGDDESDIFYNVLSIFAHRKKVILQIICG